MSDKDSFVVDVSKLAGSNLKKFKEEYESWIIGRGFDLEKIKIMTALIFLNMSPLHDDNFGKMLWFKSIEMLTNVSK